jgi:predicted acyltransferase
MSTPAIIVNAKQRAGNGQEPDAIRLLSLDLFRGATIALMLGRLARDQQPSLPG